MFEIKWEKISQPDEEEKYQLVRLTLGGHTEIPGAIYYRFPGENQHELFCRMEAHIKHLQRTAPNEKPHPHPFEE